MATLTKPKHHQFGKLFSIWYVAVWKTSFIYNNIRNEKMLFKSYHSENLTCFSNLFISF